MNNITKVSEITYSDLAEYMRLDEVSADDQKTLNNLLLIAKSYIKKYTGVDDLDSSENFVIAVFILVQDMWDNRALYVDSTNLNHVIESILSLHSVNLL